MGATLYDVVQSGMIHLDSGCGVYAPDAEAYSIFAPLFNHIIEEYHDGFQPKDKQPTQKFGDTDQFIDLDPEGTYVLSTRVRCGRSLANYPFNPLLTAELYKQIETNVKENLSNFDGELKGTYYPLSGM
uniref:arginine kinase n=1 Tax=Lygus hesperus TaxID=30085 RepID=A0A0A9YXS3_LYGHE